MKLLAALFVGQPQNILLVAGAFFAGYFMRRVTRPTVVRQHRPLLIVAVCWSLYAAWELLVRIITPEANIRVDLLVIWPILAILSSWAVFRALR